ncbi:MAG: DUF4129 domain-containing protein [Gaiellaceae bacterium]
MLVFLVALGSNRSRAHTGGPGDLTHTQLIVSDLVVLFIALVGFSASAYILWTYLMLKGRESEELGDESRRSKLLTYLYLLSPIAVTIAAFALVSHLRPQNTRPSIMAPRTLPTQTPPAAKTGADKTVAAIAPWFIIGFAVVCILIVATVLLQRRRRIRPLDAEFPESELELQRRDLRELLESSLDEIKQEPDPRRAVIRAYVGMESTLARHDLARQPSEAPGEYLTRALAAVRLSRRAAERLTRLFERARFSEHAIGPEMKQEAISALTEVRDELEAKPR